MNKYLILLVPLVVGVVLGTFVPLEILVKTSAAYIIGTAVYLYVGN